MRDATALFAIRLIFGTGVALCLMPRGGVAAAYFRIVLLVTLGLSALHALVTTGSWVGGALLGGLAFVGSVVWLLEQRRLGTALLVALTTVALIELVLAALRAPAAVGQGGAALAIASAVAGALTQGTALAGMLLGHRYLTAAGMPLAPLVRVNDFLGASALFRLLVCGLGLAHAGEALSAWPQGELLWLTLRWLAGVVGPFVVWIMVRRILRYRNTQSATGVLFVGVILTLLGELTGDLVSTSLRTPL